jgi:hypothetical protein
MLGRVPDDVDARDPASLDALCRDLIDLWATRQNITAGQRRDENTLRRAASPVLREAADAVAMEDQPMHPTGSLPQARSFQQLCGDLQPGGADLYAFYRLMSWFSHPSNHIVDKYL